MELSNKKKTNEKKNPNLIVSFNLFISKLKFISENEVQIKKN